MNVDDSRSSEQWEPVPDGTLGRMAKRLEAQHRRRQLGKLAGAGGVGAAVVAAVVLTIGFMTNDVAHFGGISCRQCQAHFEVYQALDAGESVEPARLANVTLDNLREHLAQCELCQAKFNAAYPGVLGTVGQHFPLGPPRFALLSHRLTYSY